MKKRSHPRLYRLAASTVVGLCMASPAPALDLQRADQLAVADSNGTLVGNVLDLYGTIGHVNVAFELERRFFVVTVSRATISSTNSLYFESLDCSGQGFANLGPDRRLVLPVSIRSPGSTLFTFDLSSPGVEIQAASFLVRNSDGTEECRPITITFDNVYPAIATESISKISLHHHFSS